MKKGLTALAAIAALGSLTTVCSAGEIEDLRKQMEDISVKVGKLEATGKKDESGKEGYLKKLAGGTTFGGYGELAYIFRKENGNGNGGNTLDPQRFVLYVNSDLADWVTLNTELEWEHGGSDGADGGVAVEQAYLDFHLRPSLNVKAGVMLVPMGAINQNHEPTNFNSTERPQLDRFLIPSTWQEMGAGIHGKLGEKTSYELYAFNGLNGQDFDGENGLREGRQSFGKDSNRNLAVSGRLEVKPLPRLATNLSFYSGNSAPSGSPTAYTTIAAFDGKYGIGDFDLMGEYVRVFQQNPAALGGAGEIGHRMSGYWVEGAYHLMPAALKQGKLAEADLTVFARYSELDTQEGGPADPATASGKFDRNYTTFGIVFKPITTVAIKADYQIVGDHRGAGETALDNDKFQVSLGFVF
jgi:hypothetical protein